MTTELEKLKRDMYTALADCKVIAAEGRPPIWNLDGLEENLEAYLEALAQGTNGGSPTSDATLKQCEILADAYARQQQLTHAALEESRDAWTETYELKAQLVAMTANRDELGRSNLAGGNAYSTLKKEFNELRNKLQAFEFANKSAGELLQAANEKVKRQRGSIGQLKNERNNMRLEIDRLLGRLNTITLGREMLKAVEGIFPTSKVEASTSDQSLKEISPESICRSLTDPQSASHDDLLIKGYSHCPFCEVKL